MTHTAFRRRPFEPEDMLREQRITELHLVQGHPVAVCTVRGLDTQTDGERSALWLFAADGSSARQLTRGPGRDSAPRWSADGRQIAFLSDRAGGAPQLHLIDPQGGEARLLAQRRRGWVDHAWRPDGRHLLALGSVTVDPDRQRSGTQDGDDDAAPRPDDAPEVVWRLPYKMDGIGYLLDTRVQLFLVDADSGRFQQLTRGDFVVTHAAWAPDGQAIVYSRRRDAPGQQHCSDIWLLPLTGQRAGKPRRLSHDHATAAAPGCSPDGRWIAFSGACDEGDAQMRLWLIDRASGAVQGLGDASIEVVDAPLQWHADASRLAFVRARRGLQQAAVVEVPGGQVHALDFGLRHVARQRACARVVVALESPDQPLELHSCDWDGGDLRQLSRLNPWWHDRRLPTTTLRHFRVPDGDGAEEEVDGWLMLPDRAAHPGPVPLLVDVHGGPASYVFLRFTSHAYWQVLCARGWAVLALNAVGSSSYGRHFADRLLGRWGEADLPQHMAAVAQLQREGLADARVAVAGASYGGYLSAWAIGHSRLFRAAVVCAPVANLESHYGTSDSGFHADPYAIERRPEGDRALMARLSPLTCIGQAVTPTLFLQGKDDQRCPVGQSEELYVTLARSGRAPAQMVLYPGGSHHVFGEGRPSHRLDVLRRIVDWLQRWIDQPLPAEPDGLARAAAQPVNAGPAERALPQADGSGT